MAKDLLLKEQQEKGQFGQLEDEIDTFAINDSNKLTQMQLALVYFIEFIVEQKNK